MRDNDFIGLRISHVIILGSFKKRKSKTIRTYFRCKCDCGKIFLAQKWNLLRGYSIKSCGCKTREIISFSSRKHGMSATSEYRIYFAMKKRCLDPSAVGYPRYGGRGITICDEWIKSFENFYADMGPRPSLRHSLERLDNELGYSKENCKWATATEQNNNKRSNRKYTYQDELITVAQIAKRIGMSYHKLWARLRAGWSLENAISANPIKRINQHK